MPEATATAEQTAEGAGNQVTEGTATGAGTQTAKTEDAPKFTQADQNALAAKIRKEEKEKYEKQQAESKRQADEAKAKEQGEFQTLAENRQKELDEIKPKLDTVSAELSEDKAKVAEMVDADLKALPDEVKGMSPAKYAEDKSLTNPLEVLAWLPQAKKLAEKLTGTVRRGTGGDPIPAGHGDPKADEKARGAQAGMYRKW